MQAKPLQGTRVLDLTRLLPGAVSTLHLGDLGADVIKIEDTGAGDYGRTLVGRVQKANSGLFLAINRNKRGLRLDLKQPAGRDVFMKLAKTADVIVEGFRPGVVDRLGIGFEAVRVLNPKIVYCAITGYGQTGPYKDRAGHDINYCGYTGVSDQIGPAGGDPTIPNFQIGDLLGGSLTAVMGILAALLGARSTGRGRYVDISMTDAVLAHALIPLSTLLSHGRNQPRGTDILSGGLPCYNIYATADGRHMAVGALEEKFWETLCDVLERPDLKPKRLATGEEAARVKTELTHIFTSRPQAYWADKFRNTDCCVTPILTLEESMKSEHVQARELVVRSEHPVDGEVTQFALPLKLSEYKFSIDRPAPMPGEHNTEILSEAGIATEEIERLKRDRVIC